MGSFKNATIDGKTLAPHAFSFADYLERLRSGDESMRRRAPLLAGAHMVKFKDGSTWRQDTTGRWHAIVKAYADKYSDWHKISKAIVVRDDKRRARAKVARRKPFEVCMCGGRASPVDGTCDACGGFV